MRINQNIRTSTKNVRKNSLDSSMINIKRTRGELKKIRDMNSKIRTSTSNKIHESANYLLTKILINRKFIIGDFIKL